jgi:hypothetical protein
MGTENSETDKTKRAAKAALIDTRPSVNDNNVIGHNTLHSLQKCKDTQGITKDQQLNPKAF